MSSHNDLEHLFGEALQSVQKAQIKQAQSQFHSIVQQWPDCKEAWYHLGELYQQEGLADTALEMYNKVLELDPDIQEVYFNLGLLAQQVFHPDLAIEYWQKALQINPEYHLARLNLALQFFALDRYDDAVRELTQLLSLELDTFDFVSEQALHFARLGQHEIVCFLAYALRDYPEKNTTIPALLEFLSTNILGQDYKANKILAHRKENWLQNLVTLNAPFYYERLAELDKQAEKLTQTLNQLEPHAIPLEYLAFYPRLKVWETLGVRAHVDNFLSRCLQLPQFKHRPLNSQIQKIVLFLDSSSLAWQGLFWNYLLALPASRWELHLRVHPHLLPVLKIPASLRILKSIQTLSDDVNAVLGDLNSLSPHVLLLSSPHLDPIQFVVSRCRIAPIQWAWIINGGEVAFDSGCALDNMAPHWFSPAIAPLPNRGDCLSFPMPIQGWQPQDLIHLSILAQEIPIQLIGTPDEKHQMEFLKGALMQTSPLDVQVHVWSEHGQLESLLHRSLCLLLPRFGAELYAQAATSCGLICIISEQKPQNPLEVCQALYQVRHQPYKGPDPIWQSFDILNPSSSWAVSLQDQLTRTLRKSL